MIVGANPKIKLDRKRERRDSQTPALHCAVPAMWVWSGRVCETDDRDWMGSRSDDLQLREKKIRKKGERRGETNWGGRDRPVGRKGCALYIS